MKPIILFFLICAGMFAQTMPNATSLCMGKCQFFDDSGRPLAFGLVYFYAAGGSTPQDTYTSATAGTVNKNPVVLDAGGRADIFIAGKSYKITLKTAAGTTLWTQDAVSDPSFFYLAYLSTISDSALLSYLPLGTGALSRTVRSKLNESVSVKDFGAIGDGSSHPVSGWCTYAGGTRYTAANASACLTAVQADYSFVAAVSEQMDAVAAQAAINAASIGGTLYFPLGSYITNALTIAKPLSLFGDGCGATTVKTTSGVTLLSFSGTSNVSVSGMTLDSNYPTSTTGGGILLTDITDARISGVCFTDIGDSAIDIVRGDRVWVSESYFSNIKRSGVIMDDPVSTGANSYVWVERNYFNNVNVAGTAGAAAVQSYGTTTGTQEHVWVRDNYINNSGSVGIGLDRVFYATVSGNRIIGNGTNGEGIALSGSHINVTDNQINGCGSAGVMLFAVAAFKSEYVAISGNTLWDNYGQGVALVWGADNVVMASIYVTNNTAFDTATAPVQAYGVQSYFSTGGTGDTWSDVVVAHNNLVGNATSALSLQNSTDVATFNNKSTNAFAQVSAAGLVPYVGAGGMLTTSTNLSVDSTTGLTTQKQLHLLSSTTPVVDLIWDGATGAYLKSLYPSAPGAGDQRTGLEANGHYFTLGPEGAQFQNFTKIYANLNTPAFVARPVFIYCSDCTIGTSCSGSGTGAWAFFSPASSTWTCPF
jgi:hypothetical protein